MKLFRTYRPNEAELVKECLKYNRKAQKELFDKYKDAMFTTAFRILGNEDDASDVLQEAFIEVYENLSSFRFESTLGAWIKVILVRKALRKMKLIKPLLEPLEIAETFNVNDGIPLFDAEYLEKAIMSLPDSARTIFLLIEVEGYKHQEVADMLNIATGTTKSQLHYSKLLLRKKLKELYQ